MSADTCIHRDHGLCDDCQEQRDADEIAWQEFGLHVEGERRWAEELRRIEDDMRTVYVTPEGAPW